MEEDNTIYVLEYALKKLKIKISGKAIKEFLLKHPLYPSLKSVSVALNNCGIKHYTLWLSSEEMRSLNTPFIAHSNNAGGQLIFIKKITTSKVHWRKQKGKTQISVFDDFFKKLSGATILIDPKQKIINPVIRKERQTENIESALVPIGILLISIFILLNLITKPEIANISTFLKVGVIKTIGFIASLFLVLHELKIRSNLSDKICKLNYLTNCEAVLSSDASQIYGSLKWADIGIIYFLSTFLYLSMHINTLSLSTLGIISTFALPYPIFSFYYQLVKLKSWCPFCIIVQLMLIGEFFVLLPYLNYFVLHPDYILRLMFTCLLITTLWLYYKFYFEQKNENNHLRYSIWRLKRNPEIFSLLLTNDKYIEHKETENDLILGNPNAPVTITAFMNLNCRPCANAFLQLKQLLDTSSEIKISIVYSLPHNTESLKILNTLYHLYQSKGSREVIEFLYNWYATPPGKRAKIDRSLTKDDIINTTQIFKAKLFEQYRVSSTPTIFVNGYKYPHDYNLHDIELYIDRIKEITNERKWQEACSDGS